MSDFMPDAARAPSPEALADLKALARDHGVNAELIKSLTASKEEARAHLGFFRRMMFVSNGAVMMIGAAIAIFAGQKFFQGASDLWIGAMVFGLLLFLKFFTVFISMSKALRAAEAVARKHELI